jgi:Ceramidase
MFVVLTTLLVALSFRTYSWGTWRPATCKPDHCFCEAIRTGTVAQPADTWSSLGFAFAGFLIVNAGVVKPLRVYGWALVFIGVGSAFYHASLTFIGQLVDVSGMYLLITFALLYSVSRMWKLSPLVFTATYIGTNVLLLYMQMAVPGARRYVFALLLIGVLGVELYQRHTAPVFAETKWLWRALGIFAAAFVIWILDITKAACAPNSIVQGHAIWHLLGAVSAYCLYLYFKSEREPGITAA